jgi:serine/threonine protein kinase
VRELSGYAFSPLREGDIALCRGSGTGLAPILLAATEETSVGCVERLEHEYALKAELDADWAALPVALTHHNNCRTLVLEDPGGAPLERLLGRSLDVPHFLGIAIPLARALRHVHERCLIHKDIKPANILVDAASGRVWLTGFGIASRLPREHQAPAPPEVIAGTLAYMAPEQTGRMNRSVDSRSDLYSMGVTFYEMLTGHLPFTAADPMEWSVASTSGIASLRDFRTWPDAGPLLVSLRKAGDATAYTLTSIALPNRVTLITVTQDSDGGFTIGQYFIPLGHLAAEFDYPTSSRHGDPLLDVLAASRMTRSFRRRRSVLSDLQFYSGRDLVEGNWRDPLVLLLAAYEALRRRRQENDLPTLVSTLEGLFSEMPDTEVVASRLRGTAPRLEKGLPIFMDGFVAAGGSASDLPPGSSLDYSSIWTAWHEFPPRT